jgi:flagellar hook protein FlgE
MRREVRDRSEEAAMSLFGSLFSGVSGLSAQSQAMGMISDNVSNVNTVSYKGAVAQFSTLVTRSAASALYSPGGARANTLYRIDQQGLIQASASPTDVAIDGGGFFVVNSRPDLSGEQLYTRAGSFTQDFLGNLRNSSGFYLQGWQLDPNEQIIDINQLATVNMRVINGVAAATTEVRFGANLDAGQTPFAGAYAAGDLAEYAATGGFTGVQPHMTRAVQVFDPLGGRHSVTMAFLKDDAAPNTWLVEIYADPAEVDPADHPDGLLASGSLTFNGDGTLASQTLTASYPGVTPAEVGVNWLDADGQDDSSMVFNLGTLGAADGVSQFDSDYNVGFVTQNGAEVGELNSVSIDEDGYVIAGFTNGETQKLYKLPVATFANPLALDSRTGNVYAETVASGAFNLRQAGQGGAGGISPSALEQANVDLAEEFTKMIVTQRAYSANARVITTTDQMLDELIRMSR